MPDPVQILAEAAAATKLKKAWQARVLSFLYIDEGHRSYVQNPSSVPSCHPIAQHLNELLGTGAAQTAEDAAGADLVVQAISEGNRVVHVKYGRHPDALNGHSFTLVCSGDEVKTIEAWAGNDDAAKFLDETVAAPVTLGREAARVAALNLFAASHVHRATAFGSLSAAMVRGEGEGGPLPAFDRAFCHDGVAAMKLIVCCRALKATGTLTSDITARVQATAQWMKTQIQLL